MKRFASALAVTTALLAFAPVPLTAQAQTSPRTQAGPMDQLRQARAADDGRDAEQLREEFREALNRYPRNVGRVLRMDPTLFNDAEYLAGYPAIAEFVATYPQITRNPEFYLEGYGGTYADTYPRDANARAIDTFGNFLEGIVIFSVVAAITLGMLWLIKSIVEHRRWLRMSKIQTEVHTKLLDRFSSSDELLAYMKTPAGSRFLESAPISVALNSDSPKRAVSAPLNRIIWSVQAGVVLVLAGGGLLFGRNQIAVEEVRTMLYLMGVFGVFVGIGFVLSALASYGLSRRLGLVDEGTGGAAAPSVPSGRIDSAGL